MSQDGLSPQELIEVTTVFEREALLLADLTHPNLPRIHDHFSEQGRSYVVMDFIAGSSIAPNARSVAISASVSPFTPVILSRS